MSDPQPSLSDPDYRRFAWRRYLQILGWMFLVAVATVAAALWWLHSKIGALPLHLAIGTAIGVGLSVMLAAALMGLVFLSSGTGHDEAVKELEDEKNGD